MKSSDQAGSGILTVSRLQEVSRMHVLPVAALALALAASQAGSSPASIGPEGLEVLTGSGSRTFAYDFFAGGVVIAKCDGCDEVPWVQVGRWYREGKSIRVRMEWEWLGLGQGTGKYIGNNRRYESYIAVGRKAAPRTGGSAVGVDQVVFDTEEFALDHRAWPAKRQANSTDPHDALRLFQGDHPETFKKRLKLADLAGLTPADLRLMRNEIFARYGYDFSDMTLRTHFEGVPAYRERMARYSNVDAFLSDVERENARTLQEAEARPVQGTDAKGEEPAGISTGQSTGTR